MQLSRTITTVVALTLSLLISHVARAEDRRIAVLTLSSDDPGDPLVARMSDALRNAVRSKDGYTVSDTKASLDQLSMMQDCEASEATCVDQIAKGLAVDALVHGSLSRKGNRTVNVVTEIVDTASGATRAASARFTTDAADDLALAIQASAVVDELLTGYGVEAPEPAAEPAATAPPVVEAKPAAQEAPPAAAKDEGPSVRAIAGYSLLGVAVVSVGLTALSFVQIDRAEGDAAFDNYRRAVGQMNPGAKDVCDEADAGKSYGVDSKTFSTVKDQCSAGQTYDVLQYVFLGTAVVAGGLSAWLLLGDDDDERAGGPAAAVAFRPIVGKKSAGLSARVRF